MSSTTTTAPTLSTDRYPVFEANQVLTSFHLNQLRTYLDHQDRLSRVKLVGMGVVCGLELERPSSTTIAIEEGVGVTSEGYLINISEQLLTKYVTYTDSTNYAPFWYDDSGTDTQYDLWELLEDDTTNEDAEAIPSGFLDDKVVLLFLEINDKDIKSCLGEDCTDKGQDRIFTVRALVIDKNKAKIYIKQAYAISSGTLSDYFHQRYNPEPLRTPRATFVPDGTPDAQIDQAIDQINSSAALDDVYLRALDNSFITDLSNALQATYENYEPLLGEMYNFLNPFQNVESALTAARDSNLSADSGVTLQYTYDFFRDLAKAHNEFICLAFEIVAECCPDTDLFPQHLFLGTAQLTNNCKPSVYRSFFTPSPLYDGHKEKLAAVRTYHERMVEMINAFNAPRIGDNLDTRITPSSEKRALLENRSIPFYYYPQTDLRKNWNYPSGLRCQKEYILSYYGEEDSNVPMIENPLKFDLDDFNFLRVEGLLGKELDSALTELENLIKKHNLPIDLVTARVNHADVLENVAGEGQTNVCVPQDLQNDYSLVRNELICFLSRYEHMEAGDGLRSLLGMVYSGFQTLYDTNNNPFEEVVNQLPKCLSEFDLDEFKTAYKQLWDFFTLAEFYLEQFAAGAAQLGNYGSALANATPQQIIAISSAYTQYVVVKDRINRFFNNCAYPLLISAFYHNKWRLEAATEKALLSTLIKNNPGIEHQAGVPFGGTFIVAYEESAGPDKQTIVADFSLGRKLCEEECLPCLNNKPYPPMAAPISIMVKDTREIMVDVIRESRDINVEELTIKSFDAVSQLGATIRKGPYGDREVLFYTPIGTSTGLDSFNYEIENESQLSDDGIVRVAISIQKKEKPPRKEQAAEHFDNVSEDLKHKGHMVYDGSENDVSAKYDDTVNAYENIAESLENYGIDPEGERAKIEEEVKEIQKVMTETHKAIVDRAKRLKKEGIDVATAEGKIEGSLKGKTEEIRELEALEELYNQQLDMVMNMASKEMVEHEAADSLNQYVETQVGAQMNQLETYGLEGGAKDVVEQARASTENKAFKKRIKNY